MKVYLVCDIGAAELKVNWLFWFLRVELAHSHHAALLQEQGQRVTISLVAHPQGCRYSCNNNTREIIKTTMAKKMKLVNCPLSNQVSFIFTWHCASSKDIETVQQNREVDLKTHQIFLYGELLEDLSLE